MNDLTAFFNRNHERITVKEHWIYDGVECLLVRMAHMTPHIAPYYCGYAAFPGKPLLVNEEDGLDVTVHGGITYSEETQGYAVYGFDCAHAFDEDNILLQNINYLKSEVESMAAQISKLYEVAK